MDGDGDEKDCRWKSRGSLKKSSAELSTSASRYHLADWPASHQFHLILKVVFVCNVLCSREWKMYITPRRPFSLR